MYFVDNALLTGKFKNHNVDIDFDEANPTTGKINAWVQLSTFLTGEPGRDDPGKCGPGYMGVGYLDTLYTVDPSTDTAWFNSTSIRKYGDGYLAKGSLEFRGVNKSQDLYFTYLGQKDYSNPPDGSNIRCGFMGEFTFRAQTDYGISSSSVADKVTVKINVNLRKN
jgi:polyisoprenoid-binding protein YceI